ncbi:MAG: hypothetical protein AAFX06_18255 [Planctomycetota bacterium]
MPPTAIEPSGDIARYFMYVRRGSRPNRTVLPSPKSISSNRFPLALTSVFASWNPKALGEYSLSKTLGVATPRRAGRKRETYLSEFEGRSVQGSNR